MKPVLNHSTLAHLLARQGQYSETLVNKLTRFGNRAEERERKKFSFISKSAREVEQEIARQTKQNDEDVKGKVDSAAIGEKILMGKEKGSTGSIRKRGKSGAGAGGSSSSSSGGESSPKRGKGDLDVALERKIDILVKQQRNSDANWLPKLVRVLLLVALAAYAGYTSYLESPEGVSVMMLRKDSGAPTGFDRQFFDFSSLTGAASTMRGAAVPDAVDDAAFDAATSFGSTGDAGAAGSRPADGDGGTNYTGGGAGGRGPGGTTGYNGGVGIVLLRMTN